jgi:hypothetical protein
MTHMHQEEVESGSGTELANYCCTVQRYYYYLAELYIINIITIIINTNYNTEILIHFIHLIKTNCRDFCNQRRTHYLVIPLSN